MSNDMIDYYKAYYAAGGDYTMASTNGSSRVLQIQDWITQTVPKGGRILDVGCGDMYLATALPEYSWTGIDVNVEKAKGTAVAHDLMQTPYPLQAESFDGVICSEVLEHLFDMRVVHKEIYRLLKKGGKYIMSTPNAEWVENRYDNFAKIMFDPSRPWTLEHVRHYTPAIHEKYLKEAGFKIKAITGADAHFGDFFTQATKVLSDVLNQIDSTGYYGYSGRVQQILGACFPFVSHTVMFLTEKEAK